MKKMLFIFGLISLMIGIPVSAASSEFNTEPNFEETVIADENGIKITATGLTYENSRVEVGLLYENDSDTDYSFIVGSMGYNAICVNGYMVDTGWTNTDVAAGKKAMDSVYLSYSELQMYGINEIAELYLGFYLTDEDHNYYYPEITTVRTDIADSYDYETDTFADAINNNALGFDYTIEYYEEGEFYNQADVQIVLETLINNTDNEEALFFEVVNNSSEEIWSKSSYVYVNGLLGYAGTWSSDPILPGARQVFYIKADTLFGYISDAGFDIEEMGEVTFTYVIQDFDKNDISDPQEITVTIPDRETEFNSSGDEIYSDYGITIVSKGFIESDSNYNDDIILVLLINNANDHEVTIDDVSGSVMINGWMVDYICYSATVDAESYRTMEIDMDDDGLAAIGVTSIEDIIDFGFTLSVRDYETSLKEEVPIEFQVGPDGEVITNAEASDPYDNEADDNEEEEPIFIDTENLDVIENEDENLNTDAAEETAASNTETTYSDKETVVRVQEALNSFGYNCGAPDGVVGSGTVEAIEQYQTNHDLSVTGTINDELLASLGLKN